MTLSMTAALAYCLSQGPCADPSIASKLAEVGKLAEAIPIFQCNYAQALAAGDKRLAAESAAYLGSLYRFQGEIARSLPLLRFAKANLEQGSTSSVVASAHYGMALAQDGKLESAVVELLSAGPHPAARVHLAAVFLRQRKLAAAQTAAEEVIHSTSSEDTAAIRNVRALAHLTLGRLHVTEANYAAAKRNYGEAIRLYESLPLRHPDATEASKEFDQLCRAKRDRPAKRHRPRTE